MHARYGTFAGRSRLPWEPTADDLSHVRDSIDALRERLRVARERAADRWRLAENAGAAGQEGFEHGLRAAADAHATTARELEEALAHLERCWASLHDRRRVGARAVLALRAAAESLATPADAWRDAG